MRSVVDADRLLRLLRPELEASGARWMLAGGFALAAWGSTRTTVDLDLAIDDEARPRLLPRLADLGFATLLDAEGFTNLLHPDRELGRLDIVWVEGTTSERLFRAAVERPGPDGQPLLTPSPQHLVAMKVAAIRSRPTRVFRDGEDIRLLLTLPGIDENQVRETFQRAGLLDLLQRLKSQS